MAERDIDQSTQNTQYDQIGKKYNDVKKLPATEPEIPSIMAVLKEIGVGGKKCLDLACGTGLYTSLLSSLGASHVTGYDISSSMVEAARTRYPSTDYPNIEFAVKDCSVPSEMQHEVKFDIVFASWFLNYAGSERELIDMFRVIEQNLSARQSSDSSAGRFVALTTNVNDPQLHIPKHDFYGFDILVLDEHYISPDTQRDVGIKARVVVLGEHKFSFDVFQFRKEVYERCAKDAGLELKWHKIVLPDDERRENGYWDKFMERPTFTVLEGWKVGK